MGFFAAFGWPLFDISGDSHQIPASSSTPHRASPMRMSNLGQPRGVRHQRGCLSKQANAKDMGPLKSEWAMSGFILVSLSLKLSQTGVRHFENTQVPFYDFHQSGSLLRRAPGKLVNHRMIPPGFRWQIGESARVSLPTGPCTAGHLQRRRFTRKYGQL